MDLQNHRIKVKQTRKAIKTRGEELEVIVEVRSRRPANSSSKRGRIDLQIHLNEVVWTRKTIKLEARNSRTFNSSRRGRLFHRNSRRGARRRLFHRIRRGEKLEAVYFIETIVIIDVSSSQTTNRRSSKSEKSSLLSPEDIVKVIATLSRPRARRGQE